MRSCYALASMLTACAITVDVIPLDPGVRVYVSPQLSEHEAVLWQSAGDAWAAAVPGSVVSVQQGECPDECGAVCVERITQAERDKWHAPALTFADGCTARVVMIGEAADALYLRMAMHELGHVFLGGNRSAHCSDTSDVMGGGETITAGTIARVGGR